MKIVLSPAKMLNYDQNISTPKTTQAHFLKEADYLAQQLKKMSSKELGELMKLSPALSDLNHDRYQQWEKPLKINKNALPALTVFSGEVYKGIDAATLTTEELEEAQKTIRILSGLYGILKPFDLMYPYRLEMGTRWAPTKDAKNLYQYWGAKLADFLNDEMEEGEVLINLASNEYFKAVDKKVLKAKIITPVFKDLKGDQLRVVMVYAKHARGAMARDIIQNQYKNVEDLKGYNVDGYSYSEELSTEEEWVYIR